MTPLLAAQMVYDCLLEFAEMGSNPVLAVIPEDGRVVEERHYPHPWLGFDGAPLRAYYHCHAQPRRIAGEHGHFHLFIESGPGQWSHLGALSMDTQGQPRALFGTNRWVTDEVWLGAKEMAGLSLPDSPMPQWSLVETWLFAMLHLLRPRFLALWEMRDRYLSALGQGTARELLEAREHYVVAQTPIELLKELDSIVVS